LKDLPWWIFGLRYLFGYDSKQVIKRELVVLIKAEILPSLEERQQKACREKYHSRITTGNGKRPYTQDRKIT